MEKNLRDLFEHERLKPTIIRTSQGNICILAQLRANNKHRNKIVINHKLDS